MPPDTDTKRKLIPAAIALVPRLVRKGGRLIRWGWTRALGRKHLRVRLRCGLNLDVRPHDAIGLQIFNRETYEASLRQLILSRVQPGMVVLDIGANIGYYSVLLAHAVGPQGQVVAFEPNPEMLVELRHNLALNQLHHVRVEPIALSDHAGKRELFLPPPGMEGHGSLAPNQTFTPAGKIPVATRTLDEVLLETGVTRVDLIKMDVEGGELAVCRGASKLLSGPHQPVLVFECAELLCAPFGYRAYHLLSLLENWGYAVTQVEYGMWLAQPERASHPPAAGGTERR